MEWESNKRRAYIFVAILIVLIIFAVVVFFLMRTTKCSSEECFYNALVECKRVNYALEDENVAKLYTIKGEQEDRCVVAMKILQIKKGTVELESLQGKEMECSLTLNTFAIPESDIRNCHGILKEEIQEKVIQRMHKQIIENIGQINETIGKVL